MSPRIVTLAPAATDLVCALGLADAIVGISHECDPPDARDRPVVTRSNVPQAPTTSAAEVDRAVSEAWREGRALHAIDADLVRALAPTHLVVQEICDVCAVDVRGAERALAEGAQLVRVGASSIEGLYADLRALGEALGATERAEARIAEVRARLDAVQRALVGAKRPRVVALEWGDPPFSAGHWVPELIACAGGEEVIGVAGQPSRRIEGRAILEADPQLVLYLPCGYSLAQAVDEAEHVLRRKEAQAVAATRRGDVWALDANRLFSRCTTELARAVEVLAGIFHPERVSPPRDDEARRMRVTA
jgi:iron complex transport system substrate-binding protein